MLPQDLNLALNEVSEQGADSLAAFLQGRTALQRLGLRENELGDNGAVALAAALQVLWQVASASGTTQPSAQNPSSGDLIKSQTAK